MSPDECSFTIHHWPALQEWDVIPDEVSQRSVSFASIESGAPGLLGAIGYCCKMAGGRPAAIIIESNTERYELHVPGRLVTEG